MNDHRITDPPAPAMFGCRSSRTLPAFLTKTYTIVTDPSTDSIVSWSLSGNSFIIWDHLKFSSDVLPKYFKHNNFSSFVYQLNNYGFRKIGVGHQCEYENVNFQRDKEYLLMNIRRRNQIPERVITRQVWKGKDLYQSNTKRNYQETRHAMTGRIKEEIETMKRNHTKIEWEIMALETELKCTEIKSRRLVKCLTKACDANSIPELMCVENNDDEPEKKRSKVDGMDGFEGNKVVHLLNEEFDNEVDIERVSKEFEFWEKILQGTDEEK